VGEEVEVEVPPFRASLLLVDRKGTGGAGVTGSDYQVVRDVPGKDVVIQLLGAPGSTAEVKPVGGNFRITAIDGVKHDGAIKTVSFDGKPLKNPMHRQLGEPKVTKVPSDAEQLYEATCFASDNDSHETRALRRSGPTAIPAVRKARDEFLKQPVMESLGILQEQLKDGKSDTHIYLNPIGKSYEGMRHLRLDLGKPMAVEQLVFELAYNEVPKLDAELPAAEVSADLKTWKTVPLTRDGLKMVADCGATFRYLRSAWLPERVAEIRVLGEQGKPLNASGAKLTWLFPEYRKARKAWQLDFTINEATTGSFLAVACNGKHGVEGAWVALRVDGKPMGAPLRAPSFPVNPFENGVGKTDANYTYFIPITPEMIGKPCELIVLALDPKHTDFKPDVWQTTGPEPWRKKTIVLSE
jgi:hypothetical protein